MLRQCFTALGQKQILANDTVFILDIIVDVNNFVHPISYLALSKVNSATLVILQQAFMGKLVSAFFP
jgi:hypothetical protein